MLGHWHSFTLHRTWSVTVEILIKIFLEKVKYSCRRGNRHFPLAHHTRGKDQELGCPTAWALGRKPGIPHLSLQRKTENLVGFFSHIPVANISSFGLVRRYCQWSPAWYFHFLSLSSTEHNRIITRANHYYCRVFLVIGQSLFVETSNLLQLPFLSCIFLCHNWIEWNHSLTRNCGNSSCEQLWLKLQSPLPQATLRFWGDHLCHGKRASAIWNELICQLSDLGNHNLIDDGTINPVQQVKIPANIQWTIRILHSCHNKEGIFFST